MIDLLTGEGEDEDDVEKEYWKFGSQFEPRLENIVNIVVIG